MFERFTARSRAVVQIAQKEARELKHDYIGSEHILLGLLGERDGLAANALSNLAIVHPVVRDKVVNIVIPGFEARIGQIPFTPRANKVLELSLREALSLGHNYIGTEHLLLALVRENEGVACRVLTDLGVSSDDVRKAVSDLLGSRENTEYEPTRSDFEIALDKAEALFTKARRSIEAAIEAWERHDAN